MRLHGNKLQAAKALAKLLERFEDKYIISLASRQDRRRRVGSEFARLGIDMQAAGIAWFDGLRFDEAADFPNIGVRGCFNSHLALLRQCAVNGRPMLIMEDDIQFNNAAGKAWEDTLVAGNDWDIFYFGYTTPAQLMSQQTIVAFSGSTIGGHFYGIQPGFAATMVEFMEACLTRPAGHPLGGPMYRDGAFNHYRQMDGSVRTLLPNPTLAIQFSSRSDLARDHRVYDRLPFLQPIANLARRVKTYASR